MAQVVVMPQLGNTVESCLITTWLVKVGDVVTESTLLCEIETDKSSMEVPAGVSGTVLALLAEEGDDVPVKEPLVIVGVPGEDVSNLVGGAQDASAGEPATPEPATAGLATAEPAAATALDSVEAPAAEHPGSGSAVSPRARGLAASQGIAAGQLAGTGPQGRVIERDVQAAIAAGPAAGALQGLGTERDHSPERGGHQSVCRGRTWEN